LPNPATPAGCRGVSCEAGTECKVNTDAEGHTCVEVDGCAGALCGAGTICADVPAPGTGFECVETEVDPTRCSAASCGAGFVCFQLAGGAGYECLDPDELGETEMSCAEVVCPEGTTCWDAIAPSIGHECVANTTCAEATCAEGQTCVDAVPPETGHECVEAGGFKSNMPLATVSIEPFNQNSAGLTVISSNLLSRPSASQWYEQWFAVLAN